MKVLDYQMMNVASSGVIDLGYYLYVITDREFRTQHLNECLREYYDTLIKYLDFDLSFEELVEEFEKARPIFLIGLMVRNLQKCCGNRLIFPFLGVLHGSEPGKVRPRRRVQHDRGNGEAAGGAHAETGQGGRPPHGQGTEEEVP